MDSSQITKLSKWVQILMMILSAVGNIIPHLMSKITGRGRYRKK